ncbi:hypothetical protein [Longimicrobium sp.]|uniref:hypothetical protein n=1 Tax=Longimicrobium sp. TaxID=2029185 RepID=UPI002E335E4A|nr:hypothetical protein [Longimicrobium sp.]HEX6038862.1 hypothetical protein [Longimicrobium sp.]
MTLLTLITRHRASLRRALTVTAVVVPLIFAAGALVVDGWAARRFLLLYAAPFFVAFFAWARIRVDEVERTPAPALAMDAAAVVLGAIRFVGPVVPFSGHMLFFAYSALTTQSATYRWLALVLVAETTWFKLVLWRDFPSWSLGIAAGVGLAVIRILLSRRSTSTFLAG